MNIFYHTVLTVHIHKSSTLLQVYSIHCVLSSFVLTSVVSSQQLSHNNRMILLNPSTSVQKKNAEPTQIPQKDCLCLVVCCCTETNTNHTETITGPVFGSAVGY